jgi:2-dehydro-3-deoxygluconokinase
MKKVFTLGDAMITFNPSASGPLRFVDSFERRVGGAELNFAIGCSRLGLQAKWFSRLGGDEFGKYIYNVVRGEGIDVSDVQLVEGKPSSLNFKEIREDGSAKTFYYRFESPILTLTPNMIHEQTLEGIDLVHLTGVFLAIAPQNLAITLRVLKLAKQKGIPVSFDPNIRLKLWSIEEARAAYAQVFPYVDILLTGLDELALIIEKHSKEDFEQFAKDNAIQELIIKNGGEGCEAFIDGIWTEKKAFSIQPIDTVGAGDGFDAAYIYSYLQQASIDERLTFANAVGAMVTTVKGDNEGLPELEDVQVFLGQKTAIER